MPASETEDLESQLASVIEDARGRVESFQAQAETARQEVAERFRRFLPIAERIVAIAKEMLDRLREHLQFEVVTSQGQTERLYSRSVTLDVKTDLASVVRLGFLLTHDSDVRAILLDHSLEIIPVFVLD